MNNFTKYMIKFSSIVTLSVILEIYVKGPNLFFSDLTKSILTIISFYFISWFIVNTCKTILFYVFGKIYNMSPTFLNFFPIFIKRGSFTISYNVLDLFKLSNTYELLGEDIDVYKIKVNKVKRMQSNLYVVISIFLMIFAIAFKISIFIFIFSIIYLHIIIDEFFFDGYKDEMIFDELVFSKYVSEDIARAHIKYLYENEKLLLTSPELLNNLNKLLLSCFNSKQDLMGIILNLDSLIIQLLTYPANEISIPCRGLIFDYIETRITISIVSHCSIDGIKSMLNTYIAKEWDINLPTVYLKRYNILKSHLEYPNQEIKPRNGYMFLYFNENSTKIS